ncbi:MAG TPA: LysR family transcriptional regulator [Jatrophihabitans sp.]|nr:LysR family transcriptional regulator [Jatrophihabitans sp.]
MELRQLHYFVTAAEFEHFGRAAERLHIVQPAISQQVARLERELGLQLFDRSHRQIRLTSDGAAFLPRARAVLEAAANATRAATELAAGTAGILRIGSSEGLGGRLDAALVEFRRQHPQAAVELISGRTPAKLAAVAAGQLDVAFVRAAQPGPQVRLHHLWDEPLVAAVPSCYADAHELQLATVAGLALARSPREENPGVYKLLERACQAAGFVALPGPQFHSVQDVLSAHVAGGRCWTVLYASTSAAAPPGVAIVPIDPPLTVTTDLAVRAGRPRPLVTRFVQIATEVAAGEPPVTR